MGTKPPVMDWYNKFGGHNTRPAGHTLKALGEMVELCIAAGANRTEISQTVNAEIDKADQRKEFTHEFNQNKVSEECADVIINLIVFTDINEIDVNKAIDDKLIILNQREWEADKDGVLRRPGRKNT